MIHKNLLILLAFLIPLIGFSTVGFSQTEAQTKKLDEGKVIISLKETAGTEIPKVRLLAVVNAAPAKVWEIVSNCNKFKDRMPRVLESKTLSVKGKRVTCDVTIDLPFPLSNLDIKTIAIHEAGPKVWTRRWKLLEGDFDFNNGSWKLTRFKDDPNRTLAEYKIHTSPKTSIPAGIRKMFQRTSLKKMITNIRKFAKKL